MFPNIYIEFEAPFIWTKASKVVWLQVAGLSEEHLALLRFSYTDATKKTAFENFQCSGRTWDFNLYSLRPNAYDSFLSQIIGSKNIKSDCSDYDNKPIWNYLSSSGYQIGIFESGVSDKSSLLKSRSCEGKNAFTEEATFWQMRSGKGEEFHYQGRKSFDSQKVFYDKSCQKQSCYSGLFNNVKSVWERYRKDRAKIMFMIRDFSYIKKLQNKNIAEARETLGEINKIISYFQELNEKGEDIFVLVTSAYAQNFELPSKGKEWAEFEKSGKHIFYRRASLMSPIWAMGPGSENFCGLYESAEVMKRFLWVPEGRVSPFIRSI